MNDLNIYLLGQAFDNLQYAMIGTPITSYNPTKDKRTMKHFYALCLANGINPVWAMAVTFSYFKYNNRKRKSIPIMQVSFLNKNYVNHAIQAAQIYQSYKKNQDVNYFPYLDSIYLVALKTYFEIPYDELCNSIQREKQKAVHDFKEIPYLNPLCEKLRQRYLSQENQPEATVWKYLLMIEGAYRFSAPLFLLTEQPAKTLVNVSDNAYQLYLNGCSEDKLSYCENITNLRYLRNAINMIEKVRGLI